MSPVLPPFTFTVHQGEREERLALSSCYEYSCKCTYDDGSLNFCIVTLVVLRLLSLFQSSIEVLKFIVLPVIVVTSLMCLGC